MCVACHFDEAEFIACALNWEAPIPSDILAMAADHSKRLVESAQQLLEVVLESIGRFQRELHGELASVEIFDPHKKATGGRDRKKNFPTILRGF
jgi:hypothetical protein